MTSGPLQGVNVFELCAAGVGPFATNLLGALGANVIKIEPPQGDVISIMAPYQRGISAAYTHCNLNKRSIVLDLKKKEGVAFAESLIPQSDVFIENMRFGAAAKLGFSYDRVRALNPHIVYASSPAWGFKGPLTNLPAIDGHVQMFSGFPSLTGVEGGRPEMIRHPLLDWIAGAYFAAATLTGLLTRRRTGDGQYVAMAHIGSGIAVQLTRLAEYFATGVPPQPMGSATATTAPNEAFLCQDKKYLAVSVLSEAQWQGFCASLRKPDLAADARFATNRERVKNHKALRDIVAKLFIAKPSRWWTLQFQKHRVPFSPFLDFDALLHHQQVAANDYIQDVDMPRRGHVYVGGVPWHFTGKPVTQHAAPVTGQHTEEVTAHGFGQPPAMTSQHKRTTHEKVVHALSGVRVVDASQGIAGPYASLLLADAGADVIKVEPPNGDYTRQWAPAASTGDSALFVALNRNKKSVALDLQKESDKAAFARLARESHVFLHDFTSRELHALGVDQATLAKDNIHLISCAVSAFGDQGPLADLPGSELTAQAASGFWQSLGVSGGAPLRIGADAISIAAGLQAYIGICAALRYAQKTGAGQEVAVSLLGAALNLRGANWAAQSDPDEWFGFYCDDSVKPPMHGYRTADVPVFFNLHTCTEDDYMQLLIRLGMEESLTDPRFENGGRDAVGMGRYAHEVLDVWEKAFSTMTGKQVVDLILEHHGMAVALNQHSRLFEEAQVQELGLLASFPSGSNVKEPTLLRPFTIGGQTMQPSPPPAIGEHNAHVLNAAGRRS